MALSEATKGKTYQIEGIEGREKIQHQLMNLGILPGSRLKVINRRGKNLILSLKQTRLGIGVELTDKIQVKAVD